jgi:hypothetical protein
MSFPVFPSSSPLSGSFDVTEASVNPTLGSTLSETVTVATTVLYLWSGGQSRLGELVTVSVGACVSAHSRTM